MDDLEIHPYKNYNFKNELDKEEKKLLDQYVYSFRETFFKKGKTPKIATGIGILKYKGTILRTKDNSDGIQEMVKSLFLLLKLHISHDFFNPGMNHINIKSFDFFGFNLGNNYTNKFGNMHECNQIHSTIPENINGIGNIKFYPLHFCINIIPIDFKLAKGGDEIFGINPNITDLSDLYSSIKKSDYFKKFINISSVHFGLEQQVDIFFYNSIIPTILEVILYPLPINQKKKSAIEYGKKLDSQLIINNDIQEITTYVKKGNENKEKLGVIARSFVHIYDIRNDLLHEGKKSFDKLDINFKGLKVKIYDIFQLVFKYTILNDFIDNKIINNKFSKIEINGSIFTTGNITIKTEMYKKLHMDNELKGLLDKAKSDKDLGIK